jgi:hypothetical protein
MLLILLASIQIVFFFSRDVLQDTRDTPGFIDQFDVVFIDALHTNTFATGYTRELLGPSSKRLPVFVHGIFSPFQVPEFKPCQMDLRRSEVFSEISCMKLASEQFAKEHGGRDLVYSPAQAAGEGQELTSWLARTGRSEGIVTFSPYASTEFAFRTLALFEATGLGDYLSGLHQINNPSVFFTMLPRIDE